MSGAVFRALGCSEKKFRKKFAQNKTFPYIVSIKIGKKITFVGAASYSTLVGNNIGQRLTKIQNGELIQPPLVGAWQPLCQDVVFRNGCCTVEKLRRRFFPTATNSHVDKAISGGCAVR